MHTRIRVSWRLPLFLMLLTFMVCNASWNYYGEWADVTFDPQLVNEAKREAIAENRPLLVLFSKGGNDCSHCKALWNGALCDGGSKCMGDSCAMADEGHPWRTYAQQKKIILLYINVSQMQDWYVYFSMYHSMVYSGGVPVYALLHVKDNADCTSVSKSSILNTANVDCLGASYYSIGAKINNVKLANTFDSFKALIESYFADGKETYGLALEPDGGGSDGITVQFGASDYTVKADENFIDIPVIVNKKSDFSGDFNVSLRLDNSSFGNGVVTFKSKSSETMLKWSASENPKNGNPVPKNVTVYLHEAEDARFWLEGITERTVTLTFVKGGMVSLGSENTTATVHIVKEKKEDNPYAVAGTVFSGTLMNETETMGVIETSVEEDDNDLKVKSRLRTLIMNDGQFAELEAELVSDGWDSIDDDGIATATCSTSVNKDDVTFIFDLTLIIDKEGYDTGESRLIIRRSSDEEEVASYDVIIFKNATRDELDTMGTDYTVAIKPCETDIPLGYGGMTFSVNKENRQVAYHGFLPDGYSEFEGTAPLRYRLEEEEWTSIVKEVGEFTVFSQTHATAGAGDDFETSWFSSVVKIDLDADGHGFICVECNKKRGHDHGNDEIEEAVWYRKDGKRHFSLSGSQFNKQRTLSEQLSGIRELVNQYYLVTENLNSVPKWSPILSPMGIKMSEVEHRFMGDSVIYGVALKLDDKDGEVGENVELNGTFSGSFKLYSQDYVDTGYACNVMVKGVLLSTDTDCCSTNYYPIGYGYFMLTGKDGESYSCGVKIIWGGSLLLDGVIDESLDASIKPEAPSLEVIGYDGVEATTEDLDGMLLSAGGAGLMLNHEQDVMVVDDATGFAVWLGKSSNVVLSSGMWSVYHVDLSGGQRESKPMIVTVADSVVCRMNIRPGWNFVSLPWDILGLTWNQERKFLEQYNGYLFTVNDDNSYVEANGPLKAGQAYWVYAQRGETFNFCGIKDETVKDSNISDALQGKKWYFGSDPGLDWRSVGEIWNGRKYVPVDDNMETDGLAGWWYLK